LGRDCGINSSRSRSCACEGGAKPETKLCLPKSTTSETGLAPPELKTHARRKAASLAAGERGDAHSYGIVVNHCRDAPKAAVMLWKIGE
jgi:hypothetical protein